MIRDLVELGGFDVIVTRNGDEAKAMLRRRQLPVLVVANLSLPRLDGFALLAELRRLSGRTGPPVVVVSSSKELSGAAWNLKERLGVTETAVGRCQRDRGAGHAEPRALPALRPGSPDNPVATRPSRTSAGSARRSIAICPMSRGASPSASCWSRWSSATTNGFACT